MAIRETLYACFGALHIGGGLDMDICPHCKQKMPPEYEPIKICHECQNPFHRDHKWKYKKVEWNDKVATVMVHRHCDNPSSYHPKLRGLNDQ